MASLRWNIRDLRVGDEVVVMGYPGQEGVAGRYQFKKTTVLGLNGPTGQPEWLQLSSVAQHGNSGGPVLDAAGNVIAVVTGNAMTYRVMTGEGGERLSDPELVGKSDVAITLPVLEDFLRQNATGYYQSSSGSGSTADRLLEARANRFIVPIRCYL
jgi:S1-C subfamily serine protease